MRPVSVLLLALALAGCSGNRFSQENPPRVVTVCPKLVPYTKEFQAQVAAEMKSGPPGMVVMIRDYGGLRAQVRACEQEKTE